MAITFGDAGAPSQKTINLDALFTLSVANSRKILHDNISTSNALWYKITKSKAYKSLNGGTNIEIPLMYALGTFDWFEGYDILSTDTTDGITKAVFEWREASIPIVISHREERQNAQNDGMIRLLAAKIKQANLGIREGISKAIQQGSGAGALETPQTSLANGATGIEPLAKLIQKDPTSNESVGNVNQSTSTWWQNQTKSSSATTYDGLLKEFDNLYNSCSKGPGGPPDLILVDQETYELLTFALFQRTRITEQSTDLSFPFENLKYKRALIVWDEFVPDVQNVTLTPTTAASGKGTAYFLNTQFFEVDYDSATDFVTTPFQTPINQAAKVAHIMWMGNMCISNRRKHGVLYNIARSLT